VCAAKSLPSDKTACSPPLGDRGFQRKNSTSIGFRIELALLPMHVLEDRKNVFRRCRLIEGWVVNFHETLS
jgi:hypothetical protein